ncbi:MAG: septum formation initiator family protein [Limnochordia bacterium]|jgi:cell division protein FtsL
MSSVSHGSASLRVRSEAQSQFIPQQPTQAATESTGRRVSRRPVSLSAIVVCAFSCLVLALGLVAQRSLLMLRSEELAALQNELAREQRMQDHLQLELMRARSPQRIERLARERLNLTEPQRVEYLVLAPAQETIPNQVVVTVETRETGVLAGVAKWLTDNWPRWGQAEASHLR